MGLKRRRQYTAEFKREAVELVMSPGQTFVGTARNLGVVISAWTNHSCVKVRCGVRCHLPRAA